MIFTVAFIGLLASAAVADRGLKPYRFTPGKSYLYEYSARLETGIPKISDQSSAIQIRADIQVQGRTAGSNEVKLRLSNIRTSQTDGSNRGEESAVPHEWNREYQKELTKPVIFSHENGRVVSFRAERSEPEWSINIKKAIMSLFTLDLQPKSILRQTDGNNVPIPVSKDDLTYYGVLEQGMGGECETTYELNHIPTEESAGQEFVLNVTKTRNYENCKSRPVLTKENFSLQHEEQHDEQTWSAVKGYYPIPSAKAEHSAWPQDASVKQYSSVKYNVSMTSTVAVIEGIHSEGRVVYNTFGDKIMAITQQNVTLKNQPEEEQQEIASIQSISNLSSQKHDDLSFRLPSVSLSASKSAQGQQQRMDIPHMALFGQQKWTELVKKMPQYFQTLTNAVLNGDSESKDAMQLVIEIVNTLSSLPRNGLEQLFKQIAEPGRDGKTASQEKQVMRKIFLDCLALCGTNDAAMLIKQRVVSHQVSSDEARQLLEALPHNMYLPDVKTIDAYQELCQHPRVTNRPVVHTACSVCFAKLVQTGSKKSATAHSRSQGKSWSSRSESDGDYDSASDSSSADQSNSWEETFVQKPISQSDVERYVAIAAKQLQQANTFQKKVAAIETLAHMGVAESLSPLTPFVTGEGPESVVPGYQIEEGQDIGKERNYLRTIAIYAMAHIAKRFPEQVKPLVLPVFRNTAETHETRLAAFTILMLSNPEQHILESVATELKHESDKHIVSFVTSALKSSAKLRTPCVEQLAQAAREASDSAPKVRKSSKYSQFVAKDYFDAKKSFGLMGTAELIQSRRSPIPKAGYLSLTETTDSFHEQLLEIGFNAKGLEKLVHKIAGRNGLIASILKNKPTEKAEKSKMVAIEEAVRTVRARISSSLKYRTKDSARLNVFFKLLERTSIYALDEAALFDLIEDVESTVNSWANSYANGYTGTLTKVFMPSSLMKVIPSELGLPIVVSHKNPIILSLQIRNAKLERDNGETRVSGEIEPKCMHSSYTFVFGVVPALKSAVGTHVEKTTHASLPLKLSLSYKQQENKWNVNIQPKAEREIFYHKSDAKTFVSKIHVATTPSRQWLETAQSIRSPDSSISKMEKRMSYPNSPIAAQVTLETEEKLQDPKYLQKKVQKNGIVPTIVEIFQNSGLNSREVHVSLRSEEPDYAFDYEWDADEQQENSGSVSQEQQSANRQQADQYDDNSDDEYYNSADSHDDYSNDYLMSEIANRVNSAINGQRNEEQSDSEWLRQSAGQWVQKTKDNMKWFEENKDYDWEEEQQQRQDEQPAQAENQCQQMRTQHVRENGRICFTTRPVPTCQPGCKSQATKQVTRNFHCLPMASPFTAQLVAQSETTVLDRLASKRVDFSRKLTAPSACSA